MSDDLTSRYQQLKDRIDQACARANRSPNEITLLLASKKQSVETLLEAGDLGLTVFGENRVQEAKSKISQCPSHFQWHLIGPLQSNKCRDAVLLFSMIHGVDRLSIAEEVEKWSDKLCRYTRILLEVNIAGESSKHGFSPQSALDHLETINAFPHLEIHGLMTMAPWSPDAEKSRPIFKKAFDLKRAFEDRLGVPMPVLSMGMSGDFEVAIEEGATLIRIGTAFFGSR